MLTTSNYELLMTSIYELLGTGSLNDFYVTLCKSMMFPWRGKVIEEHLLLLLRQLLALVRDLHPRSAQCSVLLRVRDFSVFVLMQSGDKEQQMHRHKNDKLYFSFRLCMLLNTKLI